ncbi:MAG: cupin domain-containing protein [Thermomicrobiales bacterium]
MPYTVFDYQHDIKNLFITPNIRGRFLRMEPGEVHARHSHDLGDELFLILDGQCDMEIDGHHEVLGPGQACIAFAHQLHQARNAGPGPMTMYLSVTPHIEPTHTHYDQETGERLPPRYNPPTAFDKADTVAAVPAAELADRHLAAVLDLARVAQAAADQQAASIAALKQAAADNDAVAFKAAMDATWVQVYATYRALNTMAVAWNDLAPRAAQQ